MNFFELSNVANNKHMPGEKVELVLNIKDKIHLQIFLQK